MEAAVEPVYDYKNDELMLQSMFHLDELLQEESLPPFPFLHHEFSDIVSIEEIRRTLVVANIDESVTEKELLDFFGNAGEVKYIRFCLRQNDPIRYCLVEFTSLISIVNGLKLNNQTIHGRVIKVYHSIEAIEKPSYLKDPESFKQYLWELKSHVEDSYKVVEKAAKDVYEYEDYCTDNQPPSKTPLKNTETAIAEIEEALSKVLSAQSLISVSICPVESQLLSILGEALGDKESIPASPESFLKYISHKPVHVGEEDLTKCTKKEPLKSKKTDIRNLHKRHRTRSRSRERKDKYHSHSASGGIGKSHHHHHEDRSRSHDYRSSGHARHSLLHISSVSSNHNGHSSCENSHSLAHKSNEKELVSDHVDNETKEVNPDKKAVAVKSIQKVPGNETENENDDQGSTEVVSKTMLQTSNITSEKHEISSDKEMEEDSVRKSKHRTPSREWHSHHDRRSRSRSVSGRRRSSSQREHHKSPDASSKRRSPSSCEKGRRGGLHRRRSRSPSLDHYHRRHHHRHVRSRSRHSESGNRLSRKLASSSSHKERWKRDESREGHHSSCQAAKGHHKSPRPYLSSPHHGGKDDDDEEEESREKRDHHRAGRSVVMVCPESYEDYLEELNGEVGGEEDLQSLQSEDMSKTETASCSGSQNNSTNGVECEDKEGDECRH